MAVRPNGSDAVIFHDLHDLAEKAATRFCLPWPIVFRPLLARKRCKIDGDANEGRTPVIRIRVHRYHRPREPLARSTILATLCHELAHLREWKHGPAHRAFTDELATWVREQGHPVGSMLHKGSYTAHLRGTK